MNSCLISIKVYTHGGRNLLKDVIHRLGESHQVEKVSCVYKVQRSFQRSKSLHDLRNSEVFTGLCLVVKVSSSASSSELIMQLSTLEDELQKGRGHKTVSLNLLVFAGEVTVTPKLTLPHPEFHLKPEELVPGSEVWEDYEHPLLKKSLGDLAQLYSGKSWGEFYAQGKSVLDF